MKYLLIILMFSISFPISTSRISTTFDFPEELIVSLYDENNQLINNYISNTKSGLNIAYEHMISSGGIIGGVDLYLFGGGEFMVGRRSDVNVSFHSLYLKTIAGFSDKISQSFSLGLVVLNTEQRDLILDTGSLLSIGLEYAITDNLSLAISKSYYNLFSRKYSTSDNVPSGPFLGSNIGPAIDLEGTTIDMKYEKFGLSVFYGFKTK